MAMKLKLVVIVLFVFMSGCAPQYRSYSEPCGCVPLDYCPGQPLEHVDFDAGCGCAG